MELIKDTNLFAIACKFDDWKSDLFWKTSKNMLCYFLYISVVQNFEYQTLTTNFVLLRSV